MFNYEHSDQSILLTDKAILIAKGSAPYDSNNALHQHNDCIRIAYIWLDHQKVTKRTRFTASAIKHDIERWAQRYISSSDLIVAAHMHPDIIINPAHHTLNIHQKFITPPIDYLYKISEAFKHPNYGDKQYHY